MTRATTPLKRVVKLLEYVKDRLQKDKTDTVEFTPEDVADASLLDSKEGLRVAIEAIDKHEDIHAQMEEVEKEVKTGLQEPKTTKVKILTCKIHVGDIKSLDFCKEKTKQELKEIETKACLVFDSNKGIFYEKHQGSSKSYKPQQNQIPRRLLDMFIENGGYVSAPEIERNFGITNKRAHDEVGKLKIALAKHIGMSGNVFIEGAGDGQGYKIKDFEVI